LFRLDFGICIGTFTSEIAAGGTGVGPGFEVGLRLLHPDKIRREKTKYRSDRYNFG